MAHQAITPGMFKNYWLPWVRRSVPQIHTFFLFTEPIRWKVHSSKNTIFDRYSEYLLGWFLTVSCKLYSLNFTAAAKGMEILYYVRVQIRHLLRMRCTVVWGICKVEAAALALRRGWFSNIKRTCSTVTSLVRGPSSPSITQISVFHK